MLHQVGRLSCVHYSLSPWLVCWNEGRNKYKPFSFSPTHLPLSTFFHSKVYFESQVVKGRKQGGHVHSGCLAVTHWLLWGSSSAGDTLQVLPQRLRLSQRCLFLLKGIQSRPNRTQARTTTQLNVVNLSLLTQVAPDVGLSVCDQHKHPGRQVKK